MCNLTVATVLVGLTPTGYGAGKELAAPVEIIGYLVKVEAMTASFIKRLIIITFLMFHFYGYSAA